MQKTCNDQMDGTLVLPPSLNDHIIIHLQHIFETTYIRIVPISKFTLYTQEIKNVYNVEINKKDIHVFYNCANLYERLTHDLKYKQFEDVNIIECISPSLWIVQSECELGMGTTLDEWFVETFIHWIRTKMNLYFEDCLENTYASYFAFSPEKIDWYEVVKTPLVEVVFTDDSINYNLLDYETNGNNNIILSRKHILSLVIKYLAHTYCLDDSKNVDETKAILVIGEVTPFEWCIDMRGVIVPSSTLTQKDVLHLFTYIQIDNALLKQVCTSKPYMDIISSKILGNILPYDVPVFSLWYSLLAPESQESVHDIITCFDFLQFTDIPLFANHCIKDSAKANVAVSPTINKQYKIFKNKLNKSIQAYDTNLVYLGELEKISDTTFKTDFVIRMLCHCLDDAELSTELLAELHQFTEVVKKIVQDDKTEAESTSKDRGESYSEQQFFLTKVYVNIFKNNEAEAPADKVVESVYQFLTKRQLSPIYKSQIEEDLVKLSVKKTKKTKGYVYGIENLSSCSSILGINHSTRTCEGKVGDNFLDQKGKRSDTPPFCLKSI